MTGLVDDLSSAASDDDCLAALVAMRKLVIDLQDLPAGFQKGIGGSIQTAPHWIRFCAYSHVSALGRNRVAQQSHHDQEEVDERQGGAMQNARAV